MGLLGYPYWFFFECLAPVIEIFCLIYFITLAFIGLPNWSLFFLLLGLIYLFAITFSILFEELTYHRYEKTSDLLKLFLIACLELLIYHPLGVWWALKGNFLYFILRKKTWVKWKEQALMPQLEQK